MAKTTGGAKARAKTAATGTMTKSTWVLSCDMRDGKRPVQMAIEVELGTPLPRVAETIEVELGPPTKGETEAVVKKVSHRVVGDSVIAHIEMRRAKGR